MDNKFGEYLEFAKDIANYAGEVMLKYFKQNNGAVVSNAKLHNEVIETNKKYLTNRKNKQ